ncbi:hypothetical protein [Caulobacter sp. S45]|nr:hypothetical protein [Caulobacter sp. S45]
MIGGNGVPDCGCGQARRRGGRNALGRRRPHVGHQMSVAMGQGKAAAQL